MKRLLWLIPFFAASASASLIMYRGPLTGSGADTTVLELTSQSGQAAGTLLVENCDSFQFGSAAGAMAVHVSYQRSATPTDYSAVSFTDLASTTQSTTVTTTTAGGKYGLRGHYSALKLIQSGATQVTGAYFNCGTM